MIPGSSVVQELGGGILKEEYIGGIFKNLLIKQFAR